MKLQSKIMLLAGSACFLAFVMIMGLFFLTFSFFFRQIREDGMRYAERDLQERARDGLFRLKDSMLTVYVRASTFYETVNLPGNERVKELKNRMASSGVSDAQMYCEYDLSKDPVFSGFYGFIRKDGRIEEASAFPSIMGSGELKDFLSDPSPDFHTAFLFPAQETWIVLRAHGKTPSSGKLFAARLELPYRGGLMQEGISSGFLLVHGDRIAVESYDSPDSSSLPDSVRSSLRRAAMRLSGENDLLTEILTDAASGRRWYVSGVCLKPSPHQPAIRIVRLHDFEAAQPVLPKILYRQERLLAGILVIITAAGLLLIFFPLVLVSRQMSVPIANAAAFANKVAAGDFSVTPDAPCGIQEIDQLLKALDCMKDRLNAMIGKLKRSHAREKNARRDAENLNRVKTDFLGTLYWECQEPISSLSGFAALLRCRLKKQEPVGPEYMNPVLDAVQLALRNISSCNEMMRELSVMDVADAEPLSPQYRDTFQLFREHDGPMLNETRRRGISIDFSYSSDLPARICIDSGKFLSMLNHITFALYRNLPPASRILCTVFRRNDEHLVICCSGSAENTVPLEYTLYTSSTRPLRDFRNADSIIHLTIARCLAHRLGASFDVQAEEERYSVSVSFPPAALTGSSASHEKVSGVSSASRRAGRHAARPDDVLFHTVTNLHSPSGRPIRVLVAEDDEPNRLLFERMLLEADCETVSCADVHTAEKSLSHAMPDVLLLDLHMRGLDRFQFLAEIRQFPGGQDLFIIVLASHLEDSERSRLVSAGADCCLLKPLNMDDLTDAMRESLKKKR